MASNKLLIATTIIIFLVAGIGTGYFLGYDHGWEKAKKADIPIDQPDEPQNLSGCSRSAVRPDGLTVHACWPESRVAYELWLSQAEGQNPRFIARQEAPEGNGELLPDTLRWSPDGTFIRYEETSLTCPANKQCSSPGDFELEVASYRVAAQNGNKIVLLNLTKPGYNQTVTSPIVIQGQARGYWFFEATSPVMLTDWDGKIIASHYIEAQGEWMTENLVPFQAILEFENPSWDAEFSKRGTLILHKHNASGLPEHDDAVEITMWFE